MPGEVLDISSQLQLFFDEELIESLAGLELKLHTPRPAEVVLRMDRPWEDPVLYDPTVILDGPHYRMWYRTNFEAPPFYTGYAESDDGIHWTKPSLGLIEFQGSKENNLVWSSGPDRRAGYVLSVFKDGNARVSEQERYKAIAVCRAGMLGLVSPDGLCWQLLQADPIIPYPEERGTFDSHNIAFWDIAREQYVAYLRGWQDEIRLIRRGVSTDFRNWSELEYLDLGGGPTEHLYKNAATPYYRRPDIHLMFPKRFVPGRKFDPAWSDPGLSDIVFMSSRDGRRWSRRFNEAFIRPGLDPDNWHERAIEVGPGLVPTGPGEMSLYMVAHYRMPSVHIRRMVLREDGLVSIHAPCAGGEMTTRPLTFTGQQLVLNYSTSAAGSLQVELQDAQGHPIPGFTLADAPAIYGDELERVVTWKGGPDVSRLVGQAVRLRFVMEDADLYSFWFTSDVR
jgi:hypothetical protein